MVLNSETSQKTSFHRSAAQSQDEVQRGLLLDVVVADRALIVQLLAGEDQTLLLRRDTFLVLYLRLHVGDRVAVLHVESDRPASQRFHKDLHRSTAQSQDEVQRGLLLDVVVADRALIVQLLAGEDQTLLLRRDTFLVLYLRLHVGDRVAVLHVESDCLRS
jgi:hypothetical protein